MTDVRPAVRVLAAIAASLLLPALVLAQQALVVRDGDQDVSGGVLRIGTGGDGCCSLAPCHANFRLDNASDRKLGSIAFTASALVAGANAIPADAVRFAPASLPQMGPRGTRVITVKLEVPAGTAPGTYRGTVTIAAAADGEHAELPVEAVVCGPAPAPALAFVAGVGQYDGSALTLVAASSCAGTGFRGEIALENTGSADAAGVAVSVSALPAGVTVRVTPQSLALAPGARATLAVELDAPAALPAGTWSGRLAARDAASAAAVETAVRFTRCEDGRAALALVFAGGDELVLVPGPAGCSGRSFAARFEVRSTGSLAVAAATPALSGLPTGVEVRFDPPSLALAPGQSAPVLASVDVPAALPAGTYRGELRVADAGSGAAAEAGARIERCPAQGPGLRIVEPAGGLRFTASGGCGGAAFSLAVEVQSLSAEPLAAAKLSAAGLPAGSQVRVLPAFAAIAPGERARFRLVALVPPSAPAGVHEITLAAEAASSRDEAPARLERCAAGPAVIRIVTLDGAAEARLAPAGADCSGTVFAGRVAVESAGAVALAEVRLGVEGFLPGTAIEFDPARLALPAGGRVEVAVRATAPASSGAGRFTGTLVARAGIAVEPARLAAAYERCASPGAPRLAIVRPAANSDPLAFAPGASGCSGDAFSLGVAVANLGPTPLANVALSFSGLPAGLVVTVRPRSLALGPGASASFAVTAGGAGTLPAGRWLGAVMARDALSGAADSAVVALERCDRPVADDPEIEPEDPGPGDGGRPVLIVEHATSKKAVRSGEILTVTVTVRNDGAARAPAVLVEERLAAGLVAVRGRSAIDGRAVADPSGTATLEYRLGDLGRGDERRLAFQVVVGPSAPLGRVELLASARSGSLLAGPAAAEIEVTRRSLRPFGAVRGVVRFDGGGPAAGVRFLLDGDREATSDENGRFGFDGVLGGEHLVSLDARSLAAGDRPHEDSRLLRLWDGTTEEVEFLLLARPLPALALYRLGSPADQ